MEMEKVNRIWASVDPWGERRCNIKILLWCCIALFLNWFGASWMYCIWCFWYVYMYIDVYVYVPIYLSICTYLPKYICIYIYICIQVPPAVLGYHKRKGYICSLTWYGIIFFLSSSQVGIYGFVDWFWLVFVFGWFRVFMYGLMGLDEVDGMGWEGME